MGSGSGELNGAVLRLAGEVFAVADAGLGHGWSVDLHLRDDSVVELIFDGLVWDDDTDGYAWTGWDYDEDGTETREGLPSTGRRLYVPNDHVQLAHVN